MTFASLMVRLTPAASNDGLLRFTAGLAGRLKATQVIGVAACQPLQIYSGPDAYVPQELIDRDRAQLDEDLKVAEKHFREALQGKVPALDWRSTVTFDPLAGYVVEQMRAADLLITAVEEKASLFDSSRWVDVADLVLRAGRPVLVVGAGVDRLDLRSVVVAWKDTRESRRAIDDALPFLKLAERVTIVEIVPGEELAEARARTKDVADWVGRHGIAAAAQAVASVGDDAARLSTIAQELGAGLLVGGAYGHTRVREWVLGGVTRDLLMRPTHCSLISH
jgi:nucleotide-binding universal stress UspA family protein